MEYQLNEVIEEVEIGLRCPDGSIIWPPDDYKGYSFKTIEERNNFPQILIGSAQELKIDPQVWISAFAWVPRLKTTMVVSKVPDEVVEMGHQWPIPEQTPVDSESSDPNE